MSAVVVSLPQTRRGRRSADQERLYQQELDDFAAAILELNSTLEFQVSSRGWCYILEEHGLQKGDFDKAQRLLNDCRKTGRLPLDICKEDDSRAIYGLFEDTVDDCEPEEFAQDQINAAQDQIDSAYDDARVACRDYTPIPWYDGLDHAVFCLVEKIDLVTLFQGTCKDYRVPIANAKGWSDLHLRAGIMRYFKDTEAKGLTPVLLYCGDHDPAGLLISSTLHKQISDMTRAVGWSPDNLIIDRFGLNADFIERHKLSWIENLQTGSGNDLADPDHSSHDKDYVQRYIRQFGIRKVEANALVTRPEAGRNLIADAITRYIPKDYPKYYYQQNLGLRQEAVEAFDRLHGEVE